MKWDGKKFVVDNEQLNVIEELGGNTDYAQPPPRSSTDLDGSGRDPLAGTPGLTSLCERPSATRLRTSR